MFELMRRAILFGVLSIAALSCLFFYVTAASPAQDSIIVERNVDVPMRDGVILRADVLRPRTSEHFPVLVYRTPYGKDEAQKEYTTFAKAAARGYVVVIQDVRGRF